MEKLPEIGMELISIPKNTSWNYCPSTLSLKTKYERDYTLKATKDNNIYTRPIWTLNHKLPMYKRFQSDKQKNSQILEETVVNIPSNLIL